MGKEINEDGEMQAPSVLEESLLNRKRDRHGRFQKKARTVEPENFKDYARFAILKRKKAERVSFERENFVAKKIQEINAKIRYHQ